MSYVWVILVTLFVTLIIQNLVTGEKKIERRIPHLYGVRDGRFLRSMAAAERGVHIEIIVPGKEIDTQITRKASRSRWGRLLEAGVQIHEFQPTMFHCKTMIVDGMWVSVGSTNFDSRSFRLNDEANLNVYDEEFAARQASLFEADKARSRRISLEEWRTRPLSEKIQEHAAGLLRSQL